LTALSDTLLMQRVAGGDMVSFETLFFRHYDRVYGILFRLVGTRSEAEDLTQEVFLKLHDQATRRRARGDDNISAWLYRVATNLGYNAVRDRRRSMERDVALVPEDSLTGTEREVIRRQEAAAVRAALARLKPRDAQLLVLRQMDFSYAECAEICGVAPGSVGTLLARAGESFRAAYQSRIDQSEDAR
jgi:RNA polymerase sigma-70 factor (ECF subfamily)